MQQRVFTIAENAPVARETYRLRLAGDTAAITAPGQFADIICRRWIAGSLWDIRLAGRFPAAPCRCANGVTARDAVL